jgi:hypothetical protein
MRNKKAKKIKKLFVTDGKLDKASYRRAKKDNTKI